MRKFLLAIILFSLFSTRINAQNESYAREILRELCSQQFYGRGYSFDSDKKAANYLINKIKNEGLTPKIQNFPITVNCFEGNAEIVIKKYNLKGGKDFLFNPESKSFYGERNIINFYPQKKKSRKKIDKILSQKDSMFTIIFDTANINKNLITKYLPKIENHNRRISKLEIVPVEKITFQGIATKQNNFTSIKLIKEYTKNTKINIKLDANLKHNYTSQNIITKIDGQIADTFIVITAHYDHIGTMGKNVYFPGAHDNASGAAMLTDLIRHYKSQPLKPYYSMLFIHFSGEEAGLIGSNYYVRNPIEPLNGIKFLINLDMLGSGDDGIMAVNGTVYNNEYQLFNKINKEFNLLKKIDKRPPAPNSDQYFFHKNNVPCIFFYTMGEYKEYHNITDKAENLPMPVYDKIFKLITEFIKNYK